MKSTNIPVILPDAVHQKLLRARKQHLPVYLYGATGFGKTSIIKEYLNYRNYLYLTGNNLEQLSNQDPGEKMQSPVVVIDDLHMIRSGDFQAKVLEFLDNPDLWVILISRAQIPGWLIFHSVTKSLVVVTEEDLCLTTSDIHKLGEVYQLTLSDETLSLIQKESQGNGFAIQSLLLKLREGHSLSPELLGNLRIAFATNLEINMFQALDADVLEFLLQISVVDEFDLELAEFVTGNARIYSLIQKAQENGNFLKQRGNIYAIRPELLLALRNYVRKIHGSAYIREYYYNAGLYYETHDELLKALAMYELCNNHNRIHNILIRSARQNPSTGHYFELRKYYQELTEDEVSDSPVLMSALSMFYSITLQPDRSEYWYLKLKDFCQTASGSARKEAISRLAYLDIGLPHRGIKNLVEIFKNLFQLMLTNDFSLPELSVTSNLPSAMNGGKDFCEWSKHDKEMALAIGKPLSMLLGKYGKGLVNEALGESLFEKGTDDFSVFSYLNKAHLEAETTGKKELLFAIVGIQTRMSLLHGNIALAFEQMDSFKKKIDTGEHHGMSPNLNAMYCRMYLYSNQTQEIENWLLEAPDENEYFFIMERYRYLTKIRVYLKNAEYAKARSLAERLLYYAEQYHRPYLIMEINLLIAILYRRMGYPWQEFFQKMLDLAYEYRFVRIISLEGSAVLPLLKDFKSEYQILKGDKRDWFKQVLNETEKMARYYPGYLGSNNVSSTDFSENAIAILKLQAEGFTAKQISEKLGLAQATIKYHTTETYRKLNVKGKTEAVQKAKSLNII